MYYYMDDVGSLFSSSGKFASSASQHPMIAAVLSPCQCLKQKISPHAPHMQTITLTPRHKVYLSSMYNLNQISKNQSIDVVHRKQLVDAQNLQGKEPKTSKPTRSQNFFDIGKAARTAPNLNATANAGTRKISRSVRLAPCETTGSPSTPTNSTNAPVDALDGALHTLGIDANDGNIYFTFDPDCISSRGEAVLTFLSPIPDEPSNSPDSPSAP